MTGKYYKYVHVLVILYNNKTRPVLFLYLKYIFLGILTEFYLKITFSEQYYYM